MRLSRPLDETDASPTAVHCLGTGQRQPQHLGRVRNADSQAAPRPPEPEHARSEIRGIHTRVRAEKPIERTRLVGTQQTFKEWLFVKQTFPSESTTKKEPRLGQKDSV